MVQPLTWACTLSPFQKPPSTKSAPISPQSCFHTSSRLGPNTPARKLIFVAPSLQDWCCLRQEQYASRGGRLQPVRGDKFSQRSVRIFATCQESPFLLASGTV